MNYLDKFCKKNNIELIYTHMIYFNDLDDYSVGVLAEDTNDLIRHMKTEKEEIKALENLKLLREFL